jgi:DHA2 family multidrug resistance protein-like MFS transporter
MEGIGAAAMFSVSVAVIRHLYPPNMLGRGLGLNAMVVATGFTLGPVIASAILSLGSWHWLFLVNIPLAIPTILLALRYVPAGIETARRFDYGPAILCTAFLGFLTLGFCSFGKGAELFRALLSLGLAALCLAALLRLQRNRPAPILPIDLLRIRLIGLSSLTSISSFTTQSLALVSLPFFLQGKLSVSVVDTGLFVAAWPLLVAIMAPLVSKLADSGRYSSGLICSFGLAILAAGMSALALLPAKAGAFDILIRLAICGIGFGLFQAPNMREIMSNAPKSRNGGASGIVALSRLLGQTMGAAIVAQCFYWWSGAAPVLSLWIGSGCALLGCVFSVMRI